jgi:hypothetical protein
LIVSLIAPSENKDDFFYKKSCLYRKRQLFLLMNLLVRFNAVYETGTKRVWIALQSGYGQVHEAEIVSEYQHILLAVVK